MDKVKGLMEKATHSGSGSNSGAPKEDYLDKGLDTVEKRAGAASGHNVDPAKFRSANEKVTDKVAGLFESTTGKDLPDKVSN